MRVLAIGATGFIGTHVLRLLVGHGVELCVLHRGLAPSNVPNAIQLIHGDAYQLKTSLHALQGFAPDVVLHMILYTEQQAQALVDGIRGVTARVVVASSADVYRNYDGLLGKYAGAADVGPLAEHAPLRETRFPYRDRDAGAFAQDYDKILVEQVAQGQPELAATILRLPAVYGPGDRQRRLRGYLRLMTRARPTILLDASQADWRWTRGYVENVAAAIALAVLDARAGKRIYNLGDEPTLCEREWIECIGTAAGWSGSISPVPTLQLPAALRQQQDWRFDVWTDTSRIRAELGYVPPINLTEALRRTIAWERGQPIAGTLATSTY